MLKVVSQLRDLVTFYSLRSKVNFLNIYVFEVYLLFKMDETLDKCLAEF